MKIHIMKLLAILLLSIGNEAPLLNYARSFQTELRAHQVRAELDASSDHMKTKIANAEQMKVHPAKAGLVIGNREMEANAVPFASTAEAITAPSRGMR